MAALSDVLIASSAALGILGGTAALAVARRRAEARRIMLRLEPRTTAHKVPRPERKALLAGLASKLERTAFGSHFGAYVARVHPQVAFSDAIALSCAAMIGGALLGLLLFAGGPIVVVTAAAGPVVLDRVMLKAGGRRTARLEQQLPEALSLQASALRAGNSVVRTLRIVAAETESPLREEMEHAVREIDLGHSLEAVLGDFGTRASSRDVDLWVTAMLVHRVTGGDLSAIVESLAARIRQRAHLREELRAMTAQGRLSGLVVGAAPLAFFLVLSVTSRGQMRILYTTPLGLLLLVGGLGLMAAGFLWIRWILRVRP